MLNSYKFTGQTKSKDNFQIKETKIFEPKDFIDILEGNLLAVMVRNYVSSHDCKTICSNFERYEDRYTRGSEAPAIYAGSYHYGKKLDDYFRESEAANRSLPKLFENAENPIANFRAAMSKALSARNREFRSARWEGSEACHFVMRSWVDSGSFSLKPHDDEAQCKDPLQKGFEIQDALPENALCAVNICLQNEAGGLLRLWNIHPDDAARAALGLELTGYPYPVELLNRVSYLDVEIRPGDLYAFDGRYVHAVTQLGQGGAATRTTLAFLLAHKGQNETIQWS